MKSLVAKIKKKFNDEIRRWKDGKVPYNAVALIRDEVVSLVVAEQNMVDKLTLITSVLVKIKLPSDLSLDTYNIKDLIQRAVFDISPYSHVEVLDDTTIAVVSPEGMQPTVDVAIKHVRFVKKLVPCRVVLEERKK